MFDKPSVYRLCVRALVPPVLVFIVVTSGHPVAIGQDSPKPRRVKAEQAFKVKPDRQLKQKLKALSGYERRDLRLSDSGPTAAAAGRPDVPDRRVELVNRAPDSAVQPFRPQDGKRLTVDLPPKYSEFDTDYDGQVGLYEWIVARREDISQFDRMDLDGDGLLTPRELTAYDQAMSDAGTKSASTTVKYERPRLRIVGGSRATISSRGGRQFLSDEAREKQAQVAEKFFAHVDRDRDGRVSADEIRQNRKLNHIFTEAGVEIRDMSADDFRQGYVQMAEFYAEKKTREAEAREAAAGQRNPSKR